MYNIFKYFQVSYSIFHYGQQAFDNIQKKLVLWIILLQKQNLNIFMNSKHIKNMDLPASRSHFNNLKNTLDNGKSCGIVFSSLVCFQLQNVRCLIYGR